MVFGACAEEHFVRRSSAVLLGLLAKVLRSIVAPVSCRFAPEASENVGHATDADHPTIEPCCPEGSRCADALPGWGGVARVPSSRALPDHQSSQEIMTLADGPENLHCPGYVAAGQWFSHRLS